MGGGGGGNSKSGGRKRRYKNWNNGRSKKQLSVGRKGLLFTCAGNEHAALREALQLVESLLEEHFPKPADLEKADADASGGDDDAEEEEEEEDAADALKRICKDGGETAATADKTKTVKPMIEAVDVGIKQCLFIAIRRNDISMGDVAERLSTDCQQELRTRHLQRVLPVDAICTASIDKVTEQTVKVLTSRLQSEAASASGWPTYSVDFKNRNSCELSRAAVLSSVTTAMEATAPLSRVHLSCPDQTLLVQIVRSLALIGVARRFVSSRRYSLRPATLGTGAQQREPPPLPVGETATDNE